jgi:hypothetical protein
MRKAFARLSARMTRRAGERLEKKVPDDRNNFNGKE